MHVGIYAGPKGRGIQYRMEKQQQDASADIYLYDVIGDSWDGTTAKQFVQDLKQMGDLKRLNIFINSEGGSVFDGVAIYNALRRHKAEKVVQVDGLAASIASVVAMAGDTIQIGRGGMMMIHNPWAGAIIVGEAKDFRETAGKIADSLDKIRESIIGTYVERTGAKPSQVSDWMNAETWFTADEAVKHGFADAITDHDVEIAALAGHDYTQFKNVPVRLREILDSATTFQNLPLSERDHSWDAGAADKRIRKWASSDGSGDKDKMDWAKYRKSFLWYDAENSEIFDGYKLPFVDIVSGALTAIWRGVTAAAQRLPNTEIPAGDKDGVRNHIARYYAKAAKQYDDDSIVPPWERQQDSAASQISPADTAKRFAAIANAQERLAQLHI